MEFEDLEFDSIAYRIVSCQNRRFSSPPRCAPDRTRTHDLRMTCAKGPTVFQSRTVSFPPLSDQPFRRKVQKSEIECHMPLTRVKEATPSTPPMGHIPQGGYRPTKFEPNPCIGLACSRNSKLFTSFCSIARGTYHVQQIGPQPAPSSFPPHRTNIRPSRSAQPFGLQKSKCLNRWTDIQANIGQTTFFQRPTRGNLRAKLSMLTHRNFLLYDFELFFQLA